MKMPEANINVLTTDDNFIVSVKGIDDIYTAIYH